MLEVLDNIDQKIFLFLNSFHSPFWDNIMWYVSKTFIWIPLYALIIFFIIKKQKQKSIFTILVLILLIFL